MKREADSGLNAYQRYQRREAQRRMLIMAAGWATLALLGVVWMLLANADMVARQA